MHMNVQEAPMSTATHIGHSRTWIHALVETERAPSLTLTRIVLGVVILPHGAQHLLGWFGGYGFDGTVAWMTGDLGIPLPFAVLAVLTEFFAPFALIVGAAGRLAGLGIAGLMLVAATTHASNGFFMNWVGTLPAGAEGFEYHLLAAAMGLAIALGGSGAWSVDRRLARALSGERRAQPAPSVRDDRLAGVASLVSGIRHG
jgi:putative oxidoreductase